MNSKCVLFARVSTREQAEEGYSLSAQEKLLKDYAQRNELKIQKVFSVPESASGKIERKLFNQLVDYVLNNNEIKIILCEKVDRITRNFKDAVKLQDWLNEDETRQLHFVKQGLIIHKNSKSGDQFMWDMFLVLARQYSNNLSEETKKGLYEKASQGWYPGNHKRGYKSIGDIGHKTWFVDTSNQEAKFIAKAFELYDTGTNTLRTVSKHLHEEGWLSSNGKAISISELHKLLIDNFYCGEFIWHGKKYEGKHEPIISKELFYRVQERLQRKIKAGKYRKHSFLLGGGLVVCGECGRAVIGEVQKGHNYYHCTKHGGKCTQRKYVREEELEKQIYSTLDAFKIDNPRLLEWVRQALKESHQDESAFHSDTIQELESKKKQIEKRLDNLYEDRLDEKINKDFYERNQQKYEEELDTVLDAINKHTKANIDYKKLGINIFELAQKGRELYEKSALMEEKKELLSFVFSNFMLKDEKLVPTFQNGFQIVALRAKDGNWLALLHTFRTYEWTKPYQPLDYSFRYMKQILYS